MILNHTIKQLVNTGHCLCLYYYECAPMVTATCMSLLSMDLAYNWHYTSKNSALLIIWHPFENILGKGNHAYKREQKAHADGMLNIDL